jgi:hypothetical protein
MSEKTTLQDDYVQMPRIEIRLRKPIRQVIGFVGGSLLLTGIAVGATLVHEKWLQHWQSNKAPVETNTATVATADIKAASTSSVSLPAAWEVDRPAEEIIPEENWDVAPTPGCQNWTPDSYFSNCISVFNQNKQQVGDFWMVRQPTERGWVLLYENPSGITRQYLIGCEYERVIPSDANPKPEIPKIVQLTMLALTCDDRPQATATPASSPVPFASPSVVVVTPQPTAVTPPPSTASNVAAP